MNENQKKQKIARIKQKAKDFAPLAIGASAFVTCMVLAVNNIKNTAKEVLIIDNEPFREVTGEEKSALLGRDDIVIQEADPGTFYFISVVPQENRTEV